MQVVTVETSAGQTRYYLANDDGTPVEPVLQNMRMLIRQVRATANKRVQPTERPWSGM